MIAKLKPNRVRRTYLGGERINAFTGFAPPDDGALRPEDWMASTTTAFNGTTEVEGGTLVVRAPDVPYSWHRLTIKSVWETGANCFPHLAEFAMYGSDGTRCSKNLVVDHQYSSADFGPTVYPKAVPMELDGGHLTFSDGRLHRVRYASMDIGKLFDDSSGSNWQTTWFCSGIALCRYGGQENQAKPLSWSSRGSGLRRKPTGDGDIAFAAGARYRQITHGIGFVVRLANMDRITAKHPPANVEKDIYGLNEYWATRGIPPRHRQKGRDLLYKLYCICLIGLVAG